MEQDQQGDGAADGWMVQVDNDDDSYDDDSAAAAPDDDDVTALFE